MTKSKNKVSLLGLVVAFVFMVAGIIMFVSNNIATVSAADLDNEIHFSISADTETIVFAPNAQTVDEVTVTYTVVTQNDGINNLVFIPEYDKDVFAISNITVNAETNLGDATITNGYSSYTGDYVKLAFDSTTLFDDAENVTLVTITYQTVSGLTHEDNGTYYFSLLLNYEELDQTRSTAYYILDDEYIGEQEEVKIIVDQQAEVALYIQQSGSLSITDATVEYDGAVVGISQNGENEVNYSFTGNGTITWTWYSDANYQNQISAPKNAGTYYLKGTMASTDAYVGATAQSAVTVSKKHVNVKIHSKSSVYGDPIVELTWNLASGSTLCPGDTLADLNVSLSTTATSSSNVGNNYHISGYAPSANYDVGFQSAYYTITARAITITAQDQTAQYTGSEPTVDQTRYTVTGATITSGVTITKQAGVNVGEYTLTPSLNNSNYSVTAQTGVFTITSVGKTADYVKSFFSGATLTYDAQEHNLLVVDGEKPNWISYTASNNNQTHANTYLIAVTATVSEQDAKNYIDASLEGDQEYVAAVYGTINPYAVTVTADNKSHVYGNTPATLTPVTVGLSNEVNVTFTVKDGNNNTITLSTSTPVGTYSIVPSATNSNYSFTFNNGQYTVSKATPVLSLEALDTEYNDHLYFVDASITVGNFELELSNSSHNNEYGFNYVIEIYNSNNQKVLNDAWISENYWLDAGYYTAKLVLTGTDNFNSASLTTEEFEIEKVLVGAPEIEYDGATATWSWEDDTVTDCDDKELHNSTVTYTIGGTEYANGTFTATAKGTYTLVITPSNTNYMVNEVELNPVYSVTFTEGTHTLNSATPTNMPAVQYVFEGEQATQPATNPSLTGYTFDGWDFDFSDYIIGEMVENGNLNIPALWIIGQRTITVVYVHSANNTYVETSKTFDVDYNSEVTITTANLKNSANINDMTTSYDLNGMSYEFDNVWNYKVTGSESEYATAPNTVNATENYTFIAVYTATAIDYNITYYFSIDGADYTESIIENDEYLSAAYNSTVNYVTPSPLKWFIVDAWYLDEARTQAAPETMPAHDITVYGALVFNVGKGDVNGDGVVTTADITLYRQWIVGGYEMTVLSNNEELYEAAEAETEDPSNTIYYIMRVADINVDSSEDIRDVSITRMSIAGGYKWDIVTGENVTGQEIIRNVYSADIDNIETALSNGGRATLSDDIEDLDKEIEIVRPESIYIDLNGHTVYIKSFVVRTTGVGATITVLNGTIKTTDGITIAAPKGNVILQDLEGWVNDNQVNLQAASNSLHIKQNVAFYNYAYEQQANQQEQVLTLTPAAVNVAKDTHVHVEEEADLVVEKLVVTEENFTAIEEIAEATISITVDSEVTNVIKVEGTCDVEVAEEIEEVKVVTPEDEAYETITAETLRYVKTEQELKDALVVGGKILIGANISSANGYLVTTDADIDLRGYTITVTSGSNVNSRAFKVDNEATLSVANGTVDAQGTKTSGCYGAFRAEVGTTLNLTNLTLKNYRGNGLNVKVLGATATLENVNITSVYGGGIEVTDDEGADGTVTGYAVLRNCVMTQSDYYDWCSTAVSVSGNSTLDVYSTSYTGTYGIYVFSSGGVVNVYGGEFTGTNYNVIQTTYDAANYGNDAIVNIYDGEFVGTYGIGNSGHEFLNIYGGTFDHDPSAYVANGYYAEENNGVYTVNGYAYVATEEELVEALANDEKYIVLTADIDFSLNHTERNARDYDRACIIDLKDATLDLNGHTIYTINASVTFGGNGATIKNGTFDLIEKNTDGSYKDGSYALIIDNDVLSYGKTGTVNVKDVICDGGLNVCCATVTVDNVSAHTTTTKFYAVWAEQEATLTINSGNFVDEQTNGKGVLATGTGEEGGAKIYINDGNYTAGNKLVYNAEANSIEIKGGTFTKDPANYVADGYYSALVDNVYMVQDNNTLIGTGEGVSGGIPTNPPMPFPMP